MRLRPNTCHFADDIFKCIFKISLKFVPKFRNNNISALVQIMARRLPGDKPLSEPMMVSLLTHICVSKLTIIGSDNGLSRDRRQAIIWTNAGKLLIGPLGTNFSDILNEILTFSFKKMRLKVSSAKRRPFCLGLNVLSCDDLSMTPKEHVSASVQGRYLHC